MLNKDEDNYFVMTSKFSEEHPEKIAYPNSYADYNYSLSRSSSYSALGEYWYAFNNSRRRYFMSMCVNDSQPYIIRKSVPRISYKGPLYEIIIPNPNVSEIIYPFRLTYLEQFFRDGWFRLLDPHEALGHNYGLL